MVALYLLLLVAGAGAWLLGLVLSNGAHRLHQSRKPLLRYLPLIILTALLIGCYAWGLVQGMRLNATLDQVE